MLLPALFDPLVHAASLSRAEVLPDDGGIVRPDHFTKLLIYTDRVPNGVSGEAAIQQALLLMRGSHCAIRAVGRLLETPGEVNGISFGKTQDEHGEYHTEPVYSSFGTDRWTKESCPRCYERPHTVPEPGKTIHINREKPYMYDAGNLAKILYHEGLHHIEFTRFEDHLPASDEYNREDSIGKKCNKYENGLMYHNDKCVRRFLAAILPAGGSCLNSVGADGTLLNPDGKPFEPDYLIATAKDTRPSPKLNRLDLPGAAFLDKYRDNIDLNLAPLSNQK